VEDLPGAGGVIPAELQPESEEARAALVAVAKGLMLFLAQHSMLACFQVGGQGVSREGGGYAAGGAPYHVFYMHVMLAMCQALSTMFAKAAYK
jgi:hypothetical protein